MSAKPHSSLNNFVVSFVQSADFFRPDNQEGIEARNEVSMLCSTVRSTVRF
jgi:hypothetical protein